MCQGNCVKREVQYSLYIIYIYLQENIHGIPFESDLESSEVLKCRSSVRLLCTCISRVPLQGPALGDQPKSLRETPASIFPTRSEHGQHILLVHDVIWTQTGQFSKAWS